MMYTCGGGGVSVRNTGMQQQCKTWGRGAPQPFTLPSPVQVLRQLVLLPSSLSLSLSRHSVRSPLEKHAHGYMHTGDDIASAVTDAMEASRYIHTYRILVSGRVQGVFYRKYTALKAAELGVTGFVRNLPDGRVEILAEGTKTQVGALEAWCHRGSPKAQVTAVDVEDCTQLAPQSDGAGVTATPPLDRKMSNFVVSR
ncbi:Acylphosphatase, putative [Leishmania shawi]|uniref:acylphosphatase n=3 Tax=Leishmania guyanensis species complex TaxID=38579 RepID=A0ABR3E5A2_9TRYP